MNQAWSPPGPAWLFCPADRPERYAKAAATADVVIIDLEDGVAAAEKPAARAALLANSLDPDRTVIRINPHGSADHDLDLQTLAQTRYQLVMLPKAESAEQVLSLAPRLAIALLETPLGVLCAAQCAAADNTAGVMWGAEDLIAALGGTSSREPSGKYRDIATHARSVTLLAAAAAGRAAVDSVYLDIPDIDGLARESADAAATGFDVKVAIHPRQVPVIRDAFTPAAEDVVWARAVLRAAESELGVFTFEGKMVDAPLLKHASQILRRASSHTTPDEERG